MVLLAYRHGLRVSELVDLRWDQVEFASGTLHVRRVKRGTPSSHPRRRTAGPAAAAARAGPQVALRVHLGTRGAV
jgi:integrase